MKRSKEYFYAPPCKSKEYFHVFLVEGFTYHAYITETDVADSETYQRTPDHSYPGITKGDHNNIPMMISDSLL